MPLQDYWLKKLAGTLEKKSFPFDHKTPVMLERRIESEKSPFPAEVYPGLLEFCRGSHLRLYKLLVSGVALLLQKYNGGGGGGDGDLIVGGPVLWQENEPINTTLALKVSSAKNAAFSKFFLQVGQVIDEAYEHGDYPISALLWQLNLLTSDDEFPLFDVTVSLDNIHDKSYLHDIHTNMKFSFLSINQSIEGTIKYNASVYEKATIKRIFRCLANLLSSCLGNMDIRLADIDILSEADKKQLLFDFNDTQTDYPRDKAIPDVFSQQVEKGPDRTAVLYQDSYLSYQELDRRANYTAAFLQAKGIVRDEPVGVMEARSLEMIVCLLGIIKAGGAYLPINLEYPPDRKEYILENAHIRFLFTSAQESFDYTVEMISLDSPDIYKQGEWLEKNSRYNDSAYIIYTSGSTGKPKGVIVEHRGVIRLVKNTNYLNFEDDIRFGQIGALEFDVSTYEIWGGLLNGHTLCIAHKDDILSPGNLKKTLLKYHIGTICIASPIFNQLLDADSTIFLGLVYLLTGGDVLSPAHINRLKSVCPKITLLNCYGPTENTTFSTAYPIDRNYDENIPIGRPIANSTCYIVDENLRLLPPGVPGELVVGGDGVARGYLNNPELTAEKFIKYRSYRSYETFINYKTGDLARWLPDGNIEFLGRIDQQVKIRGFRIEPGEIENRLLKIDYIKEAVVVDLKDAAGEKYLCAYLTATVELDITGIREKLAKNLPGYMIPSYFVQMEKLPLNINGKIDRKKLPDPRTLQRSQDYIAPRNKIEKKLAENWAEVLHINQDLVGVADDFFKIGGHSLKAAVLVAAIHKTFNVKLSIRQVFACPTIGKQAEYIKGAEKVCFAAIRPAPKKEYYRLSSAQKRMYFMTQLDKTAPCTMNN